MRWRPKPKPCDGDIRKRRKFLLFPKLIEGEWRWLEIATFAEQYHADPWVADQGWHAIEWR